jgi:pimeloyl-ACP methyl ester carboxylesterase
LLFLHYSLASLVKGVSMAEAMVNGVRLAYDVHGSGEPVVLVCGTGQPALSWLLYQVPALTEAGYQVVTFDNRGVAPSEAPPGPYTVAGMAEDAAGLIQHLDLGPCRVAGLSLGAFITQELALARPELVRGGAMMGTFGRQDAFRRAVTKAWVEFDESGVQLPRYFDAVTSAFPLFSPHGLSDEATIKQFIEMSAAMPAWTGPGRLGQHQADLTYDDRLEALAAIRVPTTVIAFELDALTPAPLCQEVAKAIRGCRYLEISGSGHAGPFEKPDEVNRALVQFFADV